MTGRTGHRRPMPAERSRDGGKPLPAKIGLSALAEAGEWGTICEMQGSSLSEAFFAAVESMPAGHEPSLEAALREYLRLARSAWPDFGIEEADFVRYVAERSGKTGPPPSAHAADLLLACACSRGVRAAIAAFQHDYQSVIDRVLSRRKAASDVADDARQILGERLLVGDAERGIPPKIGLYRGMGPLKSWVASSAATTLMMLQRASNRRRERPEESAGASFVVQLDPELEILKARYKSEVEEAIVAALEQLSVRDRTLLRLHLGEQLSIDALGAMYAVNRATAARWLAAARRSLLDASRVGLQARLRLSESECDSLVALVNSSLDVSIVRRLSET